MKKRILIWLSLLVLFTGSVAALWWAQDFSTSDPAPQANESNINASSRAVQKSPVLGKEIPGLPEYCADKLISVSGCDGMTEITSEQGNTYQLVEIGDQCWFADNLKEIPTTDRGWFGYYGDAVEEPAPGEGMLYTWDAAMNDETTELAQGVCPVGWHIPSECESHPGNSTLFNDTSGGFYNVSQERFSQRGNGQMYWLSTTHEDLISLVTTAGIEPGIMTNQFIRTDNLNTAFYVKCLLN